MDMEMVLSNIRPSHCEGHLPSSASSQSRPYLSEVVPTEIILAILKVGDLYIRDLAALASTCRRLYYPADHELYRKVIRDEQERGPGNQVPPRTPGIMISPVISWAAYNNRIGTMDKLIHCGANVNVSGGLKTGHNLKGYGYPIHYAAQAGNDKAVELLLDHGANLDAPSRGRLCHCPEGYQLQLYNCEWMHAADNREPKGLTALHMAICHGQTSTAELLIRRGASYRMVQPRTPPHLEAGMERVHDISYGAIHTAAACGQHALIHLIKRQADEQSGDWASSPRPPGSVDILNQRTRWGYPLHWAAASHASNPETINTLVALGAKLDQHHAFPDNREHMYTPLSLAAREGIWEVAMILLDLGASTDNGENHPTAVWDAQSLRQRSQPPSRPEPRNASVIIEAIQGREIHHPQTPPEHRHKHFKSWRKGREDLIRRLIENERISPSRYYVVERGYHTTPLMFCIAYAENSEVVKSLVPLLLELGADVSQQDREGNTALHHLVTSKPRDSTEPHRLMSNQSMEMGRVFSLDPFEAKTAQACLVALLDKGASVTVKNEAGLSPLDMVMKYVMKPNTSWERHRRVDVRRIRAAAAEVLQIFLAFPENTGVQVDTPLYRLIKKLIRNVVDDAAREVRKNVMVDDEIKDFHGRMARGMESGYCDQIEELRRFAAGGYISQGASPRPRVWMR